MASIGDLFLLGAIAGAGLFLLVLGYVSIEQAVCARGGGHAAGPGTGQAIVRKDPNGRMLARP